MLKNDDAKKTIASHLCNFNLCQQTTHLQYITAADKFKKLTSTTHYQNDTENQMLKCAQHKNECR